MMKTSFCLLAAAVSTIMAPSVWAMSDADDACIDHLRKVGGPDGKSGTILSSSFSEAGTLVMLEDAGGTVWRCIAYSDGAIGEMSVVEAADDGNGAMAGASPTTDTVVVKFETGSTGAELSGTLTSGSSTRYVLGAAKDQFLYVRVAPKSGELGYLIFNPDGSALLDFMTPDKEYKGQLWQSGDHVIEVVNNGGTNANYNVVFGIE